MEYKVTLLIKKIAKSKVTYLIAKKQNDRTVANVIKSPTNDESKL